MFARSRPLRSERSTDAPMDFQFTSRPESDSKPAWAASEEELNASRKRSRQDSSSSSILPSTSRAPTFGTNQNIPFIFNTATPQTPTNHHWEPPSNFSPSKAFPQTDLKDVDMSEIAPNRPDDDGRSTSRVVAPGALQRVFRSRHRSRQRRLAPHQEDDHDQNEVDDEDDNGRAMTPTTMNTSNHYTLNMPSVPAPPSELPYLLLGYLQFFFNLSLILLFLYLLLQFILTIQRDVEHRIAEYSMDVMQQITMCVVSYKNNNCENNQVPHMIQPCAEWETCMNRDPTTVGRARVGAELIGEVVNSFVESISWKTLLFSLTSLSFLTVFINALLSLYRSRLMPSAQPPPQHISPQSYQPGPYHPHFGGYLSPAPTPSWGKDRIWKAGDEDSHSPTRRRKLDSGDAIRIR